MSASTTITAPRATARQPKGWLATLVVALTMIGVVAGGCLAQDAIADAPPVPVTVANGVVLTPPADWKFGGRSEDGKTVLLSRGQGSLAISVEDGTPVATAIATLRDQWIASETVTATDVGPAIGVRPGQSVLRFGYSGTFDDIASAVEGEVTGVQGTSVGVIFDGWSGFGEYHTVRDEIDAMIAATTIP